MLNLFPSQASILKTIGKGIVGSQAEEQGRQELSSWKQGDVYFLPSNGGKAVALLHSSKTERKDSKEIKHNKSGEESVLTTSATQSGSGHAIIYVCKIPQNLVVEGSSAQEDQSKEDDIPEFRRLIESLCKKGMVSFENENEEKTDGLQYQKLSEDCSTQLRATLSEL